MIMSTADLIDRYTILLLKADRIGGPEIEEELEVFEEDVRRCPINITKYINELHAVNSTIWHLEADLRAGREGKLTLEEIGRRAIQIRDYNKKRLAIKNAITEQFKDGYKEVKKDHVSE